MKSIVSAIVFATFFATVGVTVTCLTSISLAAASNYDSVFNALTGGEVERDASRTRLLAMPKSELNRFMAEAKTRTLTRNRFQVVRAFDVLRRRHDFDAAQARAMSEILSSDPKIDVLEERLVLFLDAKSGALSPERIQSEIRFISISNEPSVRRLGRLTALIDSMQEARLKPATAQLEVLLQNDVYEIRMQAVDWFRLSPPADLKERSDFLKHALASDVVQVRERAFRTIASWSPSSVQALKKNEVLPAKCAADPSSIIRSACAEIAEKAKQP